MVKLFYILFFGILLVVTGCSSSKYSDESLNNLANCLAEKNVKEYGAFWCPNCAKQEKMFGKSYSIIKDKGVYIECDPRCDVAENELPIACRGIIGQTELCLEKKVNRYPYWEFPNGEVLIGVQELNIIAERAGCEL